MEQSIRTLVRRFSPPQFSENQEEAFEYVCSLLSTAQQEDTTEDELVDVIEQFFGPESRDGARELVLKSKELLGENLTSKEKPKVSARSLFSTVEMPIETRMEPQIPAESAPGDSCAEKVVSKSRERRAKREARKAQRRERKQAKNKADSAQHDEGDEFVDDDVSAWQSCQAEGRAWGGRGYGGRGLRGDVNTWSNIHLPNVTLQFEGNELLRNSTIQINGGHRYGLLGRNGVGKSVLLSRLAAKAIPGMPQNMRILLVKQQVDAGPETAIETLMKADQERIQLLDEQAALERSIEDGVDIQESGDQLVQVISKLGEIEIERGEAKAIEILRGLQFSEKQMNTATKDLSGGWRMRLALARALFTPSDLLLFDEPTNHLDLHALLWLAAYLQQSDHTVIVVSHDRSFLDMCTDIIAFEHKKLEYHVGNYSAYAQQQEEKAARQAQILDASERQMAKATAFIQKQESSANKKSHDPKKQRQAKMVKEKKLERIGYYREDGKRYKNFSLAKMSEDYVRVAEKVHIEADEPVLQFKLPEPTFAPGMTPGSAVVRLEDVSFGYDSNSGPLLNDLVLELTRESKIACVGRNGQGKSTLLKLITGEIDSLESSVNYKGSVWRHPNLRIGYVSQYSVEELSDYASLTVVEYAENFIRSGKACSAAVQNAGGNIRQYLGAFGLGGKLAHRQIGRLSGGERMRLCFATVFAREPHLLVADEPTNHLDMETLDSLSIALEAFSGAVIIVSHNQAFLSGFCKELWIVEDGNVEVRHSDTESFDEMFSQYRDEALSGASTRSHKRRAKAEMAKRAQQQSSRAKQSTGFIP